MIYPWAFTSTSPCVSAAAFLNGWSSGNGSLVLTAPATFPLRQIPP